MDQQVVMEAAAERAAEHVERSRSIERVLGGQFVMDGAGVKINRVLTQPLQRRLDPFLMLDAFGSDKAGDYIAGFPEHPHRGFETVSYMLAGRMRHRDSAGNEGMISDGGRSHGIDGAVQREATEPLYLDIDLPAGATFEQPLPAGHNAFFYVYRGEVLVDGKAVPQARMAILDNAAGADGVRVKAGAASRLILIAGRPLNEPIAQYGPFVMNTNDEVFQAVEDFRAGRFTSGD
jgi:redox-sensitive bicupin YhaK (pirin superfamily)